MTYADIKTRVQTRLIDLPPKVLAEVPSLVNDAIRSAQRKYNFRAMEASVTFTTVEGSLALGDIPNFKEYRDKGPYLQRYADRGKQLLTTVDTVAPMADFIDPSETSKPEFIINTVNPATGLVSFSLSPYPDIYSDWPDGDYRIVVPTYNFSAKLSADGDENWFTLNAEDYIIEQATAKGFQLDWDYDSMALWLQSADKLFQEIKQTDKKQRLAGVDTLVPMWHGANQPNVRR